jgi:O-glycosyl hydrolase
MVTGTTYQISGWVRLVNAGSEPVRLTIKKTDGAGTVYYNVGSVTAGNDQWSRISGIYPHKTSGTLTILYLYFEGPAVGVDFMVDDVSVQAQSVPVQSFIPIATIDMMSEKQEIQGFGAAGAYYMNWLCSHPQKKEIYAAIFGGLGLDILRIRNTYGISADFAGDMARLQEVTGAAQASLGRRVRLMNSSWSPPALLKSNGTTGNGGTLSRNSLGAYRYADFAGWWADSLLAYRQQGIVFDYISIQNEPDYAAVYDSCRFDPTENANFAGYHQALAAVKAALVYRVPDPPKLLGPETLSLSSAGNYLSAITNSSLLYGHAHHLYGPGSFDQPDGVLLAMRNYAAAYGTKPIFQTEYARLAGGDGFRGALNLARHIHNSLVENQAAAYIHWSLFWAPNTNGSEGYALVQLDNPWTTTSPSFKINPQYYAFRQYSKFIHTGWRRVGAVSGMSAVRVSAFRDSTTSMVSVVLINDSTATATGFAVNVPGFNVATGEIHRTSLSEQGVRVGGLAPGKTFSLPGESITTLVLSRDTGVTGGTTSISTLTQIRVSSIVLTTVVKGKLKFGQARVSVVDAAGKSVVGAKVTGQFTGDFNETRSGTSDSGGWAVLTTLQKMTNPRFSFRITSITATGCVLAEDASILYAVY